MKIRNHQQIKNIQHQPATGRGLSKLPAKTNTAAACILALQKSYGNQNVQRLFKAGTIQAKLTVSSPDDVYEQEADRVADHVMRMPDPALQTKPG
jgi:hypothetical protein